ncbi:MAG: S-layer homology domain-containing protein, partial [Candidatus Aquicultor sp.]
DTANQENPVIGFDSSTGVRKFFVAWQSERGDGKSDIKGRFIDIEPSATRHGSIIHVSNKASTHANPAMAFDSDHGKFLLAFQEDAAESSVDDDILCKVVQYGDTNLTSIEDNPVVINQGEETNPTVTWRSDDSFAVAWETLVNQRPGLEARFFNHDGTGGSAFISKPDADHDLSQPSIAFSPDSDSCLVAYRYKPNDNTRGIDYWPIGYEASDNRPPVVLDDSTSTAEDTAKTIALQATDEDDDGLTLSIVTGPAHGSLSAINENGEVIYTPAKDYNGPDSFTFKANDGIDDSNNATYSIGVTPMEDAPVANNQTITVYRDTPTDITLLGSDVENDPLFYFVETTPLHGTLSGLVAYGNNWSISGNTVKYTPDSGFVGEDTFTFFVCEYHSMYPGGAFDPVMPPSDIPLPSETATVTIHVVSRPVSGGGDITPPAAPLKLRVTSTDPTISLAWTKSPESDLAGYNLYRKVKGSSDSFKKLNDALLSKETFNDSSAEAGTTYIYYVTAVDTSRNESGRSNEVEAAITKVKGAVVFKDVPASMYCSEAAARLIALNAVSGYPDGTFRPEQDVTRAEFAKMLVVAMGWELENTSNASFPDVDTGDWSFKYIETGKAHGVLHGYKDGFFRPGKNISRGEIAKILAMALDLPKGSSSLTDINSHWAKELINSCVTADIVNGYADKTFRPNNPATRCEAAQMIAATLDYKK